jgi:NitT/TauT family transport system ATP-binding protein
MASHEIGPQERAATGRSSSPRRTGASVEVKNVSHAYEGTGGRPPVQVLEGINFNVRPGEFVALIGPSGCGKSTLLHMVGGLLRPNAGELLYDGQPVRGVNTDVGYMTQRDTLLPHRTIEANVALPLKFRHVDRRTIKRDVNAALQRVGLGAFQHAYPGQLSGGMRSRAMIARTLVYSPRTLLMDEPLGALDALLRQRMQDSLLQLWARDAPTVLYVTHEIEEALLLADRVLVFSRRPACLLMDLPVPSPRPRDTRRNPDLVQLHEQIWEALRDQLETDEPLAEANSTDGADADDTARSARADPDPKAVEGTDSE